MTSSHKTLKSAARKAKLTPHGVYCAVSGPNYETRRSHAYANSVPARGHEYRPEAIVGRQCGLRVAGLSCITNAAAGLSGNALTHKEVLSTGATASQTAAKLLTELPDIMKSTNIISEAIKHANTRKRLFQIQSRRCAPSGRGHSRRQR